MTPDISRKQQKLWCGCTGKCKSHTMKVVIDGKVQPHLNALDVLKYALDVKTGKLLEPEEISR